MLTARVDQTRQVVTFPGAFGVVGTGSTAEAAGPEAPGPSSAGPSVSAPEASGPSASAGPSASSGNQGL